MGWVLAGNRRQGTGMKWSLPALAVHRPVAMTMLVITLLCLGAIAWYLTPIEFLPKVEYPVLACWIPYPGAAPQQVENEVAVPAEGEFMTLPGMERISTHSYGGSCRVVMRFAWETNMLRATGELRDRIERLKLKLPPEVERVFIRRYQADDMPILRVALFREENQDALAHAARTILQNRLLRIPGVAEVEVSGRESESVYVQFDQDALRSLNLGIYEVVTRLQAMSINLAAGELVDANTKYFVRTVDQMSSAGELADMIVAPNGTRLGQVAKVITQLPEGVGSFAIDGKKGVFIRVQKEAEANTVATCDAVREELELIKEDHTFRGAEFFVFDDKSEIIRFAMSSLMRAGKYGSLLALTVLLIFLRRLRPTLVIASVTPLSMVSALVFLFLTGHSLNLVTMASLLICLGILVDNSIVVIENIQRHNRMGPNRFQNALRGASEVSLAIVASTATTIVVFIPVVYMETGELSMFMKEFAGPVSAALLTSLVLALTLLPLAESRTRPEKGRLQALIARLPGRGILARLGRIHPIEETRALYADLLRVTLQRRSIALGLLGLLLLLTHQIPYSHVGMQQMPHYA